MALIRIDHTFGGIFTESVKKMHTHSLTDRGRCQDKKRGPGLPAWLGRAINGDIKSPKNYGSVDAGQGKGEGTEGGLRSLVERKTISLRPSCKTENNIQDKVLQTERDMLQIRQLAAQLIEYSENTVEDESGKTLGSKTMKYFRQTIGMLLVP